MGRDHSPTGKVPSPQNGATSPVWTDQKRRIPRSVSPDPQLSAEQAYIDFAYECLDATRRAAEGVRDTVMHEAGGTFQARHERDVIWDRVASRLAQLELGDTALLFGRIDTDGEGRSDEPPDAHAPPVGDPAPDGAESFYIGRMSVADRVQNPVVVDWRAPVAEPFYRASGSDPMGLVRRRHFAIRGRSLLGMDDELFGSAAEALDHGSVQGHGALVAALEERRSGKLSDIVAPIQGEQDEVIRAPLAGVLVVQGGPGTGKTVVALHRAAYLLYTHRFPLEGQGVLVVGPNRLFLSYIDQVLPSLGEAGVHTAVIGDLIPDTRVAITESLPVARIKGDLRMVPLLRKAVKDRQRALREPLVVPFGLQRLRLSVAESREIVADVRRRVRHHNAGRRQVEERGCSRLAERSRQPISPEDLRSRIRNNDEVRYALEWMWPVLSASDLLNDLYSSRALLASAAGGRLTADELDLLVSPRHDDPSKRVWAFGDAPILDEALVRLGPRPNRRDSDVIRTYGHILVDEAQDLSPMELRSLSRRSLGGSMTVVGDIAQATSPWAHDSWDDVIDALPKRRPSVRVELSTGYRLPGPIMDLAARLLPLAAPDLEPPTSIRELGSEPVIDQVNDGPGEPEFDEVLVGAVQREVSAVGQGSVAVVCTGSALARCEAALTKAGVSFGRATRHGLDQQVTVVEVRMVKGLELDAVIVVEPADILEADDRGAQALYVALTRATQRLSLVHQRPLPAVLVG